MSTILKSCAFAALYLPIAAQAHHSIVAQYDPGNVQTITGILQSVKWANPHTIWVFSVEDEQGQTETWQAEGGAVNTLARNGLSRDLFPIGDSITIIGPISRFGDNKMIAAAAAVAGNEYAIFPALADELDEALGHRPAGHTGRW